MADYTLIEDIINDTTNWTQLRNNSKNDDSTDTYTGVNWFKFRGITASNIYISGNTWFGFGSNSEQLKVNRRDTAVWNFWRQEGTICGYNFLRMRWDGYSHYSQTSSSYRLTYDVILLETGDIVLNIVTWPTSSADGINQLVANSSISFSPGQDHKKFTFRAQDQDGNTFIVEEGFPVLAPYYTVHFDADNGSGDTYDQIILCETSTALAINKLSYQDHLVKGWATSSGGTIEYLDGAMVLDLAAEGQTITLYAIWEISIGYLFGDSLGKFYTIINGELSELSNIQSLTSELFQTEGIQSLPNSISTLLLELTDPKIYKWMRDDVPIMSAAMSAQPSPKVVSFVADLNSNTILGIDSMSAVYNGSITVRYSYDNENWTNEIDIATFLSMSTATLYGGIGLQKKIWFRFKLVGNAELTNFILNYEN